MNLQLTDPSLDEGYTELFQQELSLQIRNSQLSFIDLVMCRVFKNSKSYKIQLTSQDNVSFFYFAILDQKSMLEQANNGANRNVGEWLKNLFQGQNSYILQISTAISAQLTVAKQQKYKVYILAQLQLQLNSDKLLKQSLMYRYQRMKMRQNMLDNYWKNMCTVIKTKNPSLILQFQQSFNKKSNSSNASFKV